MLVSLPGFRPVRHPAHVKFFRATGNRGRLAGHSPHVTGSSASEDHAARFEELFRLHRSELLGFATRRIGPDRAGDVVSETFLAAWRRIDQVPYDEARAWLFATARFVIANHQRSERRSTRLSGRATDDAMTSTDSVADHSDLVATREMVRNVLAELSPLDQEVLRLSEWDQLDPQEAARVLGCNVNAYKVRLHRARKRFALRLHVHGLSQPELTTTSLERTAE